MRIRIILFLALFLSYSSGQVLAACKGGSNWLGNDAVNYDPDFSVRAHELGSSGTSSADSIAHPKTAKSKQKVSPEEGTNQTNQTLNQTGNQSAIPAKPEVKPMDLSGSWVVKFNDSASRSINLILLSAGKDRTMGSGTLADEGARIPVTARGTVTDQRAVLTIKTVVGDYVNQIDREYDLELAMVNNTLSGPYVLKSGGKLSGNGNVTVMKQ